MRIVTRVGNEIILGEKIVNVDGLDKSILILVERGDKIKKNIKKAITCFGEKNLYSVKSIRGALKESANAKMKKTDDGGWCCVCVENWTTNSRQICNDCAF